MADDVSIVVRVRNATQAGIASVNASLNRLVNSAAGMDKSFGSMKSTALSFAPALLPIAAATVPVIAGIGAAGAAVGAFGAAIMPQIGAMTDAAEAEGKFSKATSEHGKASEEAAKAEGAYLSAVRELPPATRESAAALGILKDQYKDWSNSLAGDTMPVATKGMALLGAGVSHLTPLVKTSSAELSRMETIIGGGMESPAFDTFVGKVDGLAKTSLQNATTGLLRFGQAISSGKANGPISEFMVYAKEQGPVVGDTLMNLAKALLNLVQGASETGVGMLTVVNALSGLVSAVPPEVIGDLLQLAVAIKAVKIAAAGAAVISGAMAGMAAGVGAARVAAAGAAGPMAGLGAAIGGLSKATKVALVGTGIGLLVIALGALSNASKSAPPDVEKLNTSLGKLATSGKVSGEAARAYGKDLSVLGDSLRVLARPSNAEGVQQWMTKLVGMDSTPVKKAKEDLDGVDKALANMVSGGHADLAAQAFKQVAASMEKQGLTSGELKDKLDNYKQALADAAFEQKMAADSMGLFGSQAQDVQLKLASQKQSADGLRQSIQALNDVNRQALGGMIGFEASIDAAAKAAKENAGSLRMVHGELDLNSEKARTAGAALQDLGDKTDSATAAARDAGKSWSQVNSIYERGRNALIKSAEQMGLTTAQAKKLADQILDTPNKTAKLKGNLDDLKSKLADAKKRLAAAPSSKTAKIKGEISNLKAQIAAAKAALGSLKNKTVTMTINEVRRYTAVYNTIGRPASGEGGQSKFAHGGIIGAAGGGPRSRMTLVGEQGPEILDLAPGSRVRSNPDTKRMLAGGHASTAAGGQPLQVNLIVDGKTLASVMIDPLRGKIADINGGNVQGALGRGRG